VLIKLFFYSQQRFTLVCFAILHSVLPFSFADGGLGLGLKHFTLAINVALRPKWQPQWKQRRGLWIWNGNGRSALLENVSYWI